jgi:hypothetical protein
LAIQEIPKRIGKNDAKKCKNWKKMKTILRSKETEVNPSRLI